MAASDSVLIAQLSDTHVVAGSADLDNDERLEMAVHALRRESPAPTIVLLTGDLTDTATDEQYERLIEILDPLDVPLLALPGNHDVRNSVRRAFPDTPWIDAEHASWVSVVSGIRIVGLDSTRPGSNDGECDEERAAWLAGVLAAPHDGATLIAMHHPPFATGIDWMDADGFVGIDAFRDVVGAAGSVDRIVCGHLHRPAGATVSGVGAQVGVSTAHHVALDLETDSTPQIIDEPFGYQLHVVSGRDVVTHTRYVGTGAEPYVPDWVDLL
ncbi:MAG: metallophosphoesterase [Ilumatobacter sp.]